MSSRILKKQKMVYWSILSIIILVSFFLFYSMQSGTNKSNTQAVFSPKVDLPSDKDQPQDVLMENIQVKNQYLESRMDFLEKTLMETQKQSEKIALSKDRENEKLRRELEVMKRELIEEREKKEQQLIHEDVIKEERESLFLSNPFFSEAKPPPSPRTLKFIQSDTKRKKVKMVDRTIPSGTTVKAILVSSVDAVCSLSSASDPQPVKLRILDDGHLPKCVRVKLKGGLVVASAYGDLSSERVYIRPERLTQVKANGEFVETVISGFISGEDGKNGVRGVVVDKSEKIVGNATISGIFSGASQYLQAMIRSKYCGFGGYYGCGDSSPCDGKGSCYPYGLDVAGEGATSGACSGLDLLTRYYIQRAEQVRPVIQVTAGRLVDITFTHSAELGDLYTREKIRDVREDARKEKR